jgi:hypothetical protein
MFDKIKSWLRQRRIERLCSQMYETDDRINYLVELKAKNTGHWLSEDLRDIADDIEELTLYRGGLYNEVLHLLEEDR